MGDVIDTPAQIAEFRVHTLRSALWLETKGMKRRGPSAYSIVKREFGFKGSKVRVLEQLDTLIAEAK